MWILKKGSFIWSTISPIFGILKKKLFFQLVHLYLCRYWKKSFIWSTNSPIFGILKKMLFIQLIHQYLYIYSKKEVLFDQPFHQYFGTWSFIHSTFFSNISKHHGQQTSKGRGDGTAGRGGLPMDWFFAAYATCGLMFCRLCRLWIDVFPPTDGPPKTPPLKYYLWNL